MDVQRLERRTTVPNEKDWGLTTSTRPGDVLAGRYRLIDLLTESAGGRFWRAHDNVLERYVALHVIPEDDPRAPLLLAAARESATALDARILRVLDAEMLDGKCFVVNEWGTGTSLDIRGLPPRSRGRSRRRTPVASPTAG
jgi:hypothetical protein